ncbi:hypothetical protein ACP70R_015531 [Stipagrostis hirtigluma subsp. patula]
MRTERLNLAGNGFSGRIPQSVANLSAIMFLSFSNNSLSGILPSSLET